MSKIKAAYHLVFGTKDRHQTITPEYRKELYAYIFGILQQNDCYVYRINGMADHIHILFDLNPACALSDLVKSIKQSSSRWLSENPHFPNFTKWCRGYYAFSLSNDDIEAATEYIRRQQEHHNQYGYVHEAKDMVTRMGMEWHEDDLR